MKKIFIRRICLVLAVLTLLLFSASCAKEERNAVLEYGDSYISEAMFSYWMSYYKTSLLKNYNSSLDTDTFWDGKMEDGQTVEEMTSQWAMDYIKSILVGMYYFDKLGLSISQELYNVIDQDIREKTSTYGSKAELNKFLASYGIDIETLRNIYISEEMMNASREYFGTNGEYAVTEELIEYYEKNYFCVKMIPVYTSIEIEYDEEGNYLYDDNGYIKYKELDDEKKAERKAYAEGILKLVQDGENIDSLIKEYSETDVSLFDSGVFMTANNYTSYGVDLFEAALKLKFGESCAVEGDYMTYIILKRELPKYSKLSNLDLQQLSDLPTYCGNEKYQEFVTEESKNIKTNEELLSKFSLRNMAILPNNF